jgi:ABC-type nitrate/sulfonate/bicarbonate transport system permease component
VLFNTYQGIKDTDPRYLASARVFGASEFTLLRKVSFVIPEMMVCIS